MGGDHLQGLNLGLLLRLRWLLLRVPLLLLLLLLLLRESVLVPQGSRPRELLQIEQGAPDPGAVLIDSDRHEESTVGVPA